MNEPAVQRLFLALWPDDGVRPQLVRVRDTVAAACRGHPVEAANLHVTLVFLGSTQVQRRPAVEAAAANSGGRPFELILDRVGYWPRSRVAWLGSAAPPAALIELAARLQRGLADQGFTGLDPRPYRPHVTLLRNAGGRPRLAPDLVEPVTWPVTAVSLVESVTHAAGAEYRIAATWPLAAA